MFWSYYDDPIIHGSYLKNFMQDRNINIKQRCNDLFEDYRAKCQYLLDIMPKLVKIYILIKYEDLLNQYDKILNRIAIKFNLSKLSPSYIEINWPINNSISTDS